MTVGPAQAGNAGAQVPAVAVRRPVPRRLPRHDDACVSAAGRRGGSGEEADGPSAGLRDSTCPGEVFPN